MTREIRFRAWDKSDKIMKYSDNYDNLGIFFTLKEHREEIGVEYELMQFTGLKDRKGVDIFEGDIFTHHDGNAVVKFDEGSFDAFFKCGTPMASNWFWKEDCEVIGNIHQNPELLTNNNN